MQDTIKVPTVRLAKPKARPIQLRYTDPTTKAEVRISTGTNDVDEALEQKAKLAARLLLGIESKPRKRAAAGPEMLWELFRERYAELQLNGLRPRSAESAELRLDMAERIMQPKTLGDLANSEALHQLQARLLAGECSRYGSRSAVTTRGYIVSAVAAMSFAATMGWIPAVPEIRKVKISKLRAMKGRAINGEEFDRLLDKVSSVVGEDAADSWRYLLRGLWESGLRLGELLHVHWSDEREIVPAWRRGSLPVLAIPATTQKNATEESIPLLPGFEGVLLETPEAQRFGWVFNPMKLRTGRRAGLERPTVAWAGKIVSRIGKAARIVVRGDGAGAAKFASAHDLRRSCAERLVSAGVAERDVARVLRHASVETTRKYYAAGSTQQSAGVIRERLSVPGYIDTAELT
jgi:integrase